MEGYIKVDASRFTPEQLDHLASLMQHNALEADKRGDVNDVAHFALTAMVYRFMARTSRLEARVSELEKAVNS